MQIPVDKILPNPKQPRTVFDEAELQELAGTIKSHGVIVPILVDKAPDGYYILIDGERRLRACKLNGMPTINAHIREEAKGDLLELALISNLQRADMGPIDEARAYKNLLKKHKSAAEISRRIGVSAMKIGFRLSLLDLPEEVQKIYNSKIISMRPDVLRALQALPDDSMIKVAASAATRGWTAQTIIAMAALERQRLTKPKKKSKKEVTSKAEEPSEVVETATAAPEVKAPVIPKTYKFNTYNPPHGTPFNALAMVGDRKYLPGVAVTATLGACMTCPLYKEAGPKICGQCPMVDFLNRLVVEIKKGS